MRTRPMKALACVLTTLLLYAMAIPPAHTQANIATGSATEVAAQPTAKGFVTRSGATLQLNGKRFRFGGPNIYWLGLDENVGGVDYPTYFRVGDALEAARVMSSTVVRSHLGVSTGCALCVEPSLNRFNETALRRIDYAIKAAADHDLRLIIILTDEGGPDKPYYHGGIQTFTNWFRVEKREFYTNQAVISAFKQYIWKLLNRVNSYTGLPYKDDPTIMAWELGNELEGMPASWINTISAYIRQQAPRQLIAAGQRFGINPATTSARNVDIVDVHYYPSLPAQMIEEVRTHAAQVTENSKVYIAGEYPSTIASDGLLTPLVQDQRVTGALFWSLFAHNDTYGYVQHSDLLHDNSCTSSYTLHYPGDTPLMRGQAQAIKRFNRAMNPAAPPPSAPGIPLITSIVKKYGENIIAWRGTTVATRNPDYNWTDGYLVQRSTAGPNGPWWTVSSTSTLVTDNGTPWIDLRSPASAAWYRVIALDENRRLGRSSEPVGVGANQEMLVDPLQSWRNTYSHSDTLEIVPRSHSAVEIVPRSSQALVRPARGSPPSGPPSQVTWFRPGTVGVELKVLSPRPNVALRLLISADGAQWSVAAPTVTPIGPSTYALRLSNLPSVNFVRVEWPRDPWGMGNGPPAEVTQAALRYAGRELVDDLNDWSNVQRSKYLVLDSTNPDLFGGDTSRVKRWSSTSEYIIWHMDGLKAFNMTTYFHPDEPVSPFSVYTSADASSWTPARPLVTGPVTGTQQGAWLRYSYTLGIPGSARYLKVVWNNLSGRPESPQIARARLYATVQPVLPAPSSFVQLTPTAAATSVSTMPQFTWSPARNAAYYSLKVSTHPDLSAPLIDVAGIPAARYTPASELAPGTTYYWRVTATNRTRSTPASNAGGWFRTATIPTAPLVVENFEAYGSTDALRYAWQRNLDGGTISVSLDSTHTDGSPHSMAANYTLDAKGFAGVKHDFHPPQNWWGYNSIRFWLQPDGSGRKITIQFVASCTYWEASFPSTGTAPRVVALPFSSFITPGWAQPRRRNLGSVSQLSIYVGGTSGSGTLFFDSFEAYRR